LPGLDSDLHGGELLVFDVFGSEADPVDTTAAGDVFNGALAVALAEKKPLKDALSFASAVAALSVTRPGAQPSAPTRSEVESFLSARPPSIRR